MTKEDCEKLYNGYTISDKTLSLKELSDIVVSTLNSEDVSEMMINYVFNKILQSTFLKNKSDKAKMIHGVEETICFILNTLSKDKKYMFIHTDNLCSDKIKNYHGTDLDFNPYAVFNGHFGDIAVVEVDNPKVIVAFIDLKNSEKKSFTNKHGRLYYSHGIINVIHSHRKVRDMIEENEIFYGTTMCTDDGFYYLSISSTVEYPTIIKSKSVNEVAKKCYKSFVEGKDDEYSRCYHFTEKNVNNLNEDYLGIYDMISNNVIEKEIDYFD